MKHLKRFAELAMVIVLFAALLVPTKVSAASQPTYNNYSQNYTYMGVTYNISGTYSVYETGATFVARIDLIGSASSQCTALVAQAKITTAVSPTGAQTLATGNPTDKLIYGSSVSVNQYTGPNACTVKLAPGQYATYIFYVDILFYNSNGECGKVQHQVGGFTYYY